MRKEQFQTLLQFFKALADESRLKIVGILANQECSVEELAVLLQLKEPTVSHHLSKLKELNLVTMRPEGNSRFYQLDSEVLQNLSQEIFTPEKMASLIEDVDVAAWESKVLKNYLESDSKNIEEVPRLKEIPASRKKRLVILKWLASKFDEGVQYPERVVNETLQLYHPDYATLRRELIGYKLMTREEGVYWRI
ncbi:transcriptional regulator [Tolypothrix tenuis PCC 7101]|uniref:Transcriptional regulator n=1 Tax=Tolypothrix tenuis PCC 7101 TaxID=231146 RepID=A0A1Z4N6J6_9CYAN|nr:metalloregulator ArsR/SmtB family transcription factor [Aulosira sp. FACHB-113]BAZ01327.1 transcriptional regulator [Tolypothrix tenuis PCC 7101]BAZ74750.1 transcriptional regulator [Aulosira laxa NIES-50]